MVVLSHQRSEHFSLSVTAILALGIFEINFLMFRVEKSSKWYISKIIFFYFVRETYMKEKNNFLMVVKFRWHLCSLATEG